MFRFYLRQLLRCFSRDADGTLAAFLHKGERHFTITSLTVDGYGDVAFDRGAYSETVVIEGVAQAITVTGKYVVIARKEADGSWLWTMAIVNHDAPLPEVK